MSYMFNLKLDNHTQQSRNYDFSIDVKDFFSERKSGHMSKWLYSVPMFEGDKACGANVWAEMVEISKHGGDYYVFHEEKQIIKNALPKIKEIFVPNSRLVDLGPGSIDALTDKIIPILQGIGSNICEYTAVDVCNKILKMAELEVSKRFCFLKTSSICKDFFNEDFTYGDLVNNEVAVIFGLTLYNMSIDPRIKYLPERMLTSWLINLKNHSKDNSYLVVTQDTNNDYKSLNLAYRAIEKYFYPLLHRISRDIYIYGEFDPYAFTMEVDFFPDTQACAMCFIPQKNMSFEIDGEKFNINKGNRFYFHNAFKFNVETFKQSANRAGFDIVHTEKSQGNSCVLHILKS